MTAFFILAAYLALPSAPFIAKFGGPLAGYAYFFLMPIGLWWLARRRAQWTKRIFFIFWFALLVVFILAFPRVNSGLGGSGGSDRDDSLRIACSNVLKGISPYSALTPLGLRVDSSPAAITLGLPFYLMGNVGYQNFIWLAVVFYIYAMFLGSSSESLLLLSALLFLFPEGLRQLMTADTLLANAIYAFVATWAAYRVITNPGSSRFLKVLASAAFAFISCARMNYVLLLPLFYFSLAKNKGWRAALSGAIVAAVASGLHFSFFLHDKYAAHLWEGQNIHAIFYHLDARATLLLSVTYAIIATILGLRSCSGSERGLIGACAIQQGTLFVLTCIARYVFFERSFPLALLSYCVIGLFFALPLLWVEVRNFVNRQKY
jgi:hypothetical protein